MTLNQRIQTSGVNWRNSPSYKPNKPRNRLIDLIHIKELRNYVYSLRLHVSTDGIKISFFYFFGILDLFYCASNYFEGNQYCLNCVCETDPTGPYLLVNLLANMTFTQHPFYNPVDIMEPTTIIWQPERNLKGIFIQAWASISVRRRLFDCIAWYILIRVYVPRQDNVCCSLAVFLNHSCQTVY